MKQPLDIINQSLIFGVLAININFAALTNAKQFCDTNPNLNYPTKKLLTHTTFQCLCEPYDYEELKDKPSLIKFWVKGRLANKMLGYALLLAMEREYGFRTFMHGQVLEHLEYFFKKVDQIESLDSLCNEEQEYPWEDYIRSPMALAQDDNLKTGHCIDYVNDARLMANNINKNVFWHELLNKHEAEIREALTLKDHFMRGADKRIARFRDKFLAKKAKKSKGKKVKTKEIIYVGIHIRLRDAMRDMVKAYNMPFLTTSYYISAMSLLVDKLQTKTKELMFLVTTDSPVDAQHQIMPRFKRSFNAYLIGSGHVNNRKSVGLDLAIMARCNYTILSYGTFSFFSGFLSGGPRIIPAHILNSVSGPKWKNGKPVKYQEPFFLTDVGLDY